MSSIKNPAGDAVTEFFLNEVVPAGRALRERVGEPFPRGFDPQAASYYTQRKRTAATRADFELPMDDLAGALKTMWMEQDRPELARLAPATAELARGQRTEQEQEETISPFIYAMF